MSNKDLLWSSQVSLEKKNSHIRQDTPPILPTDKSLILIQSTEKKLSKGKLRAYTTQIVGKQTESDTRNEKFSKPTNLANKKLRSSHNSLMSRHKAASSKFSVDDNDIIVTEGEEKIDVKVHSIKEISSFLTFQEKGEETPDNFEKDVSQTTVKVTHADDGPSDHRNKNPGIQ